MREWTHKAIFEASRNPLSSSTPYVQPLVSELLGFYIDLLVFEKMFKAIWMVD